VSASATYDEDTLWLNGEPPQPSSANPRLAACLADVRQRATQAGPAEGRPDPNWKVRICSANNFPTAAGLASSAAGYACLVHALCHLYKLDGDMSALARRGSGSACRSVYGGFVQWSKGSADDGVDSLAECLFPASYWPQMRALILVVNDGRKKVASSKGMKLSVETSKLLKFRADEVVPKRMTEMTVKRRIKHYMRTYVVQGIRSCFLLIIETERSNFIIIIKS